MRADGCGRAVWAVGVGGRGSPLGAVGVAEAGEVGWGASCAFNRHFRITSTSEPRLVDAGNEGGYDAFEEEGP